MGEPYIMRRGTFKGRPITEPSIDYLTWMLKENVLEAPQAREELERRAAEEAKNGQTDQGIESGEGGDRGGTRTFDLSRGVGAGAFYDFNATKPLPRRP